MGIEGFIAIRSDIRKNSIETYRLDDNVILKALGACIAEVYLNAGPED